MNATSREENGKLLERRYVGKVVSDKKTGGIHKKKKLIYYSNGILFIPYCHNQNKRHTLPSEMYNKLLIKIISSADNLSLKTIKR